MKSDINWNELLIASFIGILLSFIISIIDYNSLLTRIGKKLKVTNSINYKTIWDNFQNINDIEWVMVRDFDNNLNYYGNISLFSDNEEKKEILMEDVSIYDNTTAELIDERPAVYIELDNKNFVIEVEQIVGILPNKINIEEYTWILEEISKLYKGCKKEKLLNKINKQYNESKGVYLLNKKAYLYKREKIIIQDIHNKYSKEIGE